MKKRVGEEKNGFIIERILIFKKKPVDNVMFSNINPTEPIRCLMRV